MRNRSRTPFKGRVAMTAISLEHARAAAILAIGEFRPVTRKSETIIVHHRFSSPAAVAASALLLAPVLAAAAPQPAANPIYGRWSERDIKNLDFELRPGAKPDQLVLVIPSAVTFPGSHEFVLAKRPDGVFASQEPGRPRVVLAFESAAKAKLKVHGQGATKTGTWVAINDYTLVRR
jgi:hypothetical protein